MIIFSRRALVWSKKFFKNHKFLNSKPKKTQFTIIEAHSQNGDTQTGERFVFCLKKYESNNESIIDSSSAAWLID